MFHYIFSEHRKPNTDTSDYQGLGNPDPHPTGHSLFKFGLEMRPRMVRPPVDICRGTSPSQAEKSRPLPKAAPSPTAETMALAMIGPIPGRRAHTAGLQQWPCRQDHRYFQLPNYFRDAVGKIFATQENQIRPMSLEQGRQQCLHERRVTPSVCCCPGFGCRRLETAFVLFQYLYAFMKFPVVASRDSRCRRRYRVKCDN